MKNNGDNYGTRNSILDSHSIIGRSYNCVALVGQILWDMNYQTKAVFSLPD